MNARTDLGERIGGTIVVATAGGLASVAGGGKFANGAVTAAFGYLYNQVAPPASLSGSIFGISAAEAMGLSAQQDISAKYQEISQNVSVVGGGQVELTAISGMQVSAGGILTFVPLDAGAFVSVGWMSGVNVGAGGFGGFVVGGSGTLQGTGSTFGVSSVAGGSFGSFNSNNDLTGIFWTTPATKFGGVSGGLTQTCLWSARNGGGC